MSAKDIANKNMYIPNVRASEYQSEVKSNS